MTHPTTTRTHAAHPLARAAGIDVAIVVFAIAAALLSFATGQGAPDWRNIVFPPVVMILAAITMWLTVAEVRNFWRNSGDSAHKGTAIIEVAVALVAMVVVGPMLVIMPFVFFGAIF